MLLFMKEERKREGGKKGEWERGSERVRERGSAEVRE